MLSAVPCCGGARGASVSWHPTGTGDSQGHPWAQTAPRSPPSLRVPSHMPSKSHLQRQRQRLDRCATGFALLRAAKGCPQGFPSPSWGWLGARGFPASSSGGHGNRRTDIYAGSSQTDFFLLLKTSIPQWGSSHDRGLFIFMLTTSWLPVCLAL